MITLGDGNVVNVHYKELHQQLELLKQAVSESDSITESEKLDTAVDIESLKDQLAKPTPNKTVIGHLWSAIQKSVTLASFIEYVGKIQPLIASLLP